MTIPEKSRSLTAAAAVSAATLLIGAAAFAFDPPAPDAPQPGAPPPAGSPQQPTTPPDNSAPPAAPNPNPGQGAGNQTNAPGTTTITDATQAPQGTNDLITVASKDPSLSTFVRLLREAGMSSTLSGSMSGPYTVFAPSNSAFSRVPQETMTWLEKPENRASLVTVLKNHIVNGKITRADLKASGTSLSLKTLAGTTLPTALRAQSSLPTIGGANIRTADVTADNGSLYVIDSVLPPPTSAYKTGTSASDSTPAPGQTQQTAPAQPPADQNQPGNQSPVAPAAPPAPAPAP